MLYLNIFPVTIRYYKIQLKTHRGYKCHRERQKAAERKAQVEDMPKHVPDMHGHVSNSPSLFNHSW